MMKVRVEGLVIYIYACARTNVIFHLSLYGQGQGTILRYFMIKVRIYINIAKTRKTEEKKKQIISIELGVSYHFSNI